MYPDIKVRFGEVEVWYNAATNQIYESFVGFGDIRWMNEPQSGGMFVSDSQLKNPTNGWVMLGGLH